MKPLPLFAVHDGSSKRSALTCKYKCGDACFHEVPNTSKGQYFGDIVKTAMSRRGVIKGGAMAVLAVGAGSALAACSTDEPATTGGATSSTSGADTPPVDGVDFVAVEPNTEDAVVIPEGHEQAVVIRWGDPVLDGAPAFDFDNQTGAAQAMQFGFNNDFAGLLPVEGTPNAFLLVVNHEYTTEPAMFKGYDEENPTREQFDVA
ncbi:alkaline phosphatase PhoX, partial [Rhodococcus sp. EPR-279]